MKLTTGITHFPFKISLDNNKLDVNENFFLIIDRSSLPCDINVGNQAQAKISIGEDERKSINFDDVHMNIYVCSYICT